MQPGKWFKSTKSGNDGQCVEVQWKKSTRSGPYTDNCVEVRTNGDQILVRDSKLGDGSPVLSFTPDEWDAFVAGVKDLEFDLPA